MAVVCCCLTLVLCVAVSWWKDAVMAASRALTSTSTRLTLAGGAEDGGTEAEADEEGAAIRCSISVTCNAPALVVNPCAPYER